MCVYEMEQTRNSKIQKALCDFLLDKWLDQIPSTDNNDLYEEMFNKYFVDKYEVDMLNGLGICPSNPKSAFIELSNRLDVKTHKKLFSLLTCSLFIRLTNKETREMNALMEQLLLN